MMQPCATLFLRGRIFNFVNWDLIEKVILKIWSELKFWGFLTWSTWWEIKESKSQGCFRDFTCEFMSLSIRADNFADEQGVGFYRMEWGERKACNEPATVSSASSLECKLHIHPPCFMALKNLFIMKIFVIFSKNHVLITISPSPTFNKC